MLDRAALDRYIAEGNPSIFHVTPEQNVRSILSNGLRPGSEVGVATRDGFFRPRSGRSYLIAYSDIVIVDDIRGEPRLFEIDLTKLDPHLIDPDEDTVAEHFSDFPEMASAPPPPKNEVDANNKELPGQDGKRAAWADGVEGFDRSEVTERSLLQFGRVAYRGVVPPDALRLVEVPSPVLEAFAETVPPAIRWALPEAPHASKWRTEAARSRALLAEVASGACEAIGCEVEVRVDNVYHARDTVSALLKAGSATFLQAGVQAGEAVVAAKEAVDAVQAFTCFSPRADRDTAVDVARRSGNALKALSRFDPVVAKTVAVQAFDAACATPPVA